MRKKEKHLNMINEMSQLQMCEICTSLHELPWRFRRWMLHVLRPWQKAANLYNQENDHIAIRATYYIFCCRNRNWDSPDLLQCWYLFFPFFLSFFFLFFLFFCFLNNPISSSICKLPIRCEIYNCTFKNTNKVSIRQNCQNCAHLLTRILMEDLTLFDF